VYPTQQCNGNAADQATGAAKVSANCQCGSTAIGDAATTCKYCLQSANYVGVNGALAACSTTDGSAVDAKGPNSCICGTGATAEACGSSKYCYTAATYGVKCRSSALSTCSNTVGGAAVDDDCLCGTIKIAKTKFCIASINAWNTAALGNCASNNGQTAVAANAACKCGPSSGTRSDDICAAGQFCDGSQAGTGNNGANGKCLASAAAPTPAPTAAPTFGTVTIVQKLTMSGALSTYTGDVKTLAEQAYGKALGIFDTTASPPAYAAGCSVTSTAARRAFAVTFTASTSASTGAAANTAASTITTASYATAAAAVKSANTAYSSITPAAATAIAPATTTAVSPNVSGASTVTTSIMAMAVAVLVAFQARQ